MIVLHYKYLTSETPEEVEENQENVVRKKFASVAKHPKLRYLCITFMALTYPDVT
jgi:hypothetical protein